MRKNKKKLILNLDKIGVIGLLLTVILSPCCFPMFAFVSTGLGIGNTELLGSWTTPFFLIMTLIIVIGLYFSYRKHRNLYPLLLAFSSSFIIVLAEYIGNEIWKSTLYVAMFGLLISTIWNYFIIKKINRIIFYSTITCPFCGYKKNELMPTDSCTYFYECHYCLKILKPNDGDCCVFCSFGSIPCPPIQNCDKCC